jgi:exoribonuclease-2
VRREQSVKLDHLPVLLRVPSLPADLASGQRVRLAVENIDLLAPELSCRFLNLLGATDQAEAVEEAAEEAE